MNAYRIGILFAAIAALSSMVICRPLWLSANTFLDTFISHEIIAALIVILTITFASVANMHLSINRIERGVSAERRADIVKIRSSINSEAWLLFWMFLLGVAALVLKGAAGDDIHLKAAAHAIVCIVLLVNMLVLHTIYRAIFNLVAAQNVLTAHSRNPKGQSDGETKGTEDFTGESPPTG
jgi:hypothetical protein